MKLKLTTAITIVTLMTAAPARVGAQPLFLPTTADQPGSIFKVLNPAKYEHDQQVIKQAQQKKLAERQAEIKARADAIEAARLAAIAKQQADAAAAIAADYAATAARIQPVWSIPNNYAALNCTAYVASRVAVPGQMGNANMWGYGLLAAGWRTGNARRGAVGVSTRGWAGHVVLAEYVNGDGSIHISEYNYIPYSYDERDVAPGNFAWYYP